MLFKTIRATKTKKNIIYKRIIENVLQCLMIRHRAYFSVPNNYFYRNKRINLVMVYGRKFLNYIDRQTMAVK